MLEDTSNKTWDEIIAEDGAVASPKTPISHPKEHSSSITSTPKLDCYNVIPEGEYQVQYIGYDGPKRVFSANEQRVFIHWQVITMGPHFEKRLFQPFKHYKEYGRRSKFYRNWTIANGSHPKRKNRMTLQVFENKIFLAHIRTVRPVYQEGPLKGKEQDESMHYSIVDELIKKVQG